MGRVVWTAEAERWLSEIHDHIADDNPAAAQRTVRGIYERGLSLGELPERGYRHTSRGGKPLRILLYGHYRIAYSLDENRDVTILEVFHGALDIEPSGGVATRSATRPARSSPRRVVPVSRSTPRGTRRSGSTTASAGCSPRRCRKASGSSSTTVSVARLTVRQGWRYNDVNRVASMSAVDVDAAPLGTHENGPGELEPRPSHPAQEGVAPMRSNKKRSISPSRSTSGSRRLDPPATSGPSAGPAGSGGSRGKAPLNAFTPHYLEKARHLEEPPFLREARFTGPWDVERVDTPEGSLHAVIRRAESVSEGGRALAVFPRRVDALVTAASFAALATRSHLSINTSGSTAPTRRRLGFPLHDGTDHIGHLSRPEEELLPYLHAVRCLVANPEAMSLALEAMGSEVSAMVGRAVMRRLV